MNRSTTIKTLTGAAILAVGLAAGAAAQAQPAYSSNGYYYDPCRREQTSRGIVGGVVGAAAGAALGNNIASGGHRGDGSLLGGVVGAIAGSQIGRSGAACSPSSTYAAPAYSDNSYYQGNGYSQGYNQGYQSGYYDAPQAQTYYAPPPPPATVYVQPTYVVPAAPVYGYPYYPRRGSHYSFSYYGR